MCLLAVIAEEPSYGYEMVRKLGRRGLDVVGEGAIYPVLSRLQKAGHIEGYLVESPGGPARKYYRITASGRTTLRQWTNDWDRLVAGVQQVVKGENRG